MKSKNHVVFSRGCFLCYNKPFQNVLFMFFLVNNWPNKVLSNSSSLIKIKSQVSDVHNYIFITVILNIKSSSILCQEKSFFHFFVYTIKKQDQLFGPHIVFVLDWQSDTCTRNWNLCSCYFWKQQSSILKTWQKSANCYDSTFQQFLQLFRYVWILQVPRKISKYLWNFKVFNCFNYW